MAWLARIYTLIGPIEGNLLRTFGLLAFAAMEEIVWRGLVASDIKQELGARRAVPIAAGLYALSYFPTVVTLADPIVGKNPLVVLTALGAGLVWTFLAVHTNRLFAVFVSHAVFAYFAGMPLSFM
jgi:membrane protease YdiL (CAAX protease family)